MGKVILGNGRIATTIGKISTHYPTIKPVPSLVEGTVGLTQNPANKPRIGRVFQPCLSKMESHCEGHFDNAFP